MALATVGKGDAGAHLRPTTDRVRESLFNILTQYDILEGAQVLDLFAGTGALGLEALSRGATHVTFVDDGRVAQRLIRQNISKLRVVGNTDFLRLDARRLPQFDGAPCNVVFLDPPYGKDLGPAALSAAVAGGWLAAGAFVIWEEAQAMSAPEGFERLDHRKYGDTHITFLSKTPQRSDTVDA